MLTVWVQRFKDRPTLMLQWTDPDTGKRKSKSAGTADEGEAEKARGDLEYELNNGLHKEAARMPWAKFRELFEAEYLPGCKERTREGYANTLDLFERICSPKSLRSITARTVSAFAAGLRREPGLQGEGMMASTVKVRLQFRHTALAWAAKQKFIAECPAFPSVKVPKKRPQPVPSESFERLLAKAKDPALGTLLLCCWLAGLRRNEAYALEREPSEQVPWVDLARDRIILPAEFVKAVEDQWSPWTPTCGRRWRPCPAAAGGSSTSPTPGPASLSPARGCPTGWRPWRRRPASSCPSRPSAVGSAAATPVRCRRTSCSG
jgi:hypothetical protein